MAAAAGRRHPLDYVSRLRTRDRPVAPPPCGWPTWRPGPAARRVRWECDRRALPRLGSQQQPGSLAYEESARLYRLALDVGGPTVDQQLRCRLLIDLADALWRARDMAPQRSGDTRWPWTPRPWAKLAEPVRLVLAYRFIGAGVDRGFSVIGGVLPDISHTGGVAAVWAANPPARS